MRMKGKQSKTISKNGPSFEALDKALNHAEEMFDRCVCPFFLMGKTLKGACENEQIKGDKVELGVMARYVTPEVLSTFTSPDFSTHLDDFKLSENKIEYKVEGVPVEIKIIHKHYGCLANPNTMVYKFADFKIPNPLGTFYKIQGIIR